MERIFKVVVIGDKLVGKTSFIQHYSRNVFTDDYRMTIGVNFASKVLSWSEKETVRLHLWDIAGQENLTNMTNMYYRGASGCVVMFDVTSRRSFENAAIWKHDMDSKAMLPNDQPIPCLLLANKCDLPQHAITQCDMKQFSDEHAFLAWQKVSVKKNKNIFESMRILVQNMMTWEDLQMSCREEGIVTLVSQERKPPSCC
uniref:Ras-related protein Rab n=1 Tax=Eptatretus burgeri TaxID=7764 RepID=A0A8C4R4D7_EPTBU